MEEQIAIIKKELDELKENFFELKRENDEIKEKYKILTEKKYEIYYQRFLEKKLNATHKQTKHGITDITTETEHIEIKHWKNYKNALGQLLSYNFQQNKKLCAYFFGDIKEMKKNCIIELFKSKNVNIKELIDTPHGIEIRDILIKKEEDEILKFFNNNIYFSKGSYLELKNVCQLFFNNKSNVGVKEKGKLRKEIEKVIKIRYPQINNKCQRTTIDGNPFQGWINFKLK